MEYDVPRSTCHQAFTSWLVCVTEPSLRFPSVFPSTASCAPTCAAVYPLMFDDWLAALPTATSTGMGVLVGVAVLTGVLLGVFVTVGVGVILGVLLGIGVLVGVAVARGKPK